MTNFLLFLLVSYISGIVFWKRSDRFRLMLLLCLSLYATYAFIYGGALF